MPICLVKSKIGNLSKFCFLRDLDHKLNIFIGYHGAKQFLLRKEVTMDSLSNWDDRYNTGNFIIDYQHKRLVRLINELEDMQNHQELRPFLLKTIFDEVSSYTDYHFKTEENLMSDVRYSDLEDHKRLHRNFVQKLSFFDNEFKKGTMHIDREFCAYLKEWLFNHIGNEDPKFISELVTGHGLV